MESITFAIIFSAAWLGVILKDWRLFVASLLMYISTVPSAVWTDPPHETLITIAAIDLFFVALFFVLSNVVYGTVMACLLLCNSIASILFFIDYNTGGGFFYSQYENINSVITLFQAVALIVIGGMRVRNIGIVEYFYDVRISSYTMLLSILSDKKRSEIN